MQSYAKEPQFVLIRAIRVTFRSPGLTPISRIRTNRQERQTVALFDPVIMLNLQTRGPTPARPQARAIVGGECKSEFRAPKSEVNPKPEGEIRAEALQRPRTL